MDVTSKRHFLWSLSLTFTIVICMTVVCLYISHTAEKRNFSSGTVKQEYLHSDKLIGEDCIPTCDSKECVMQANSILSLMDSSVDPCDNADSFICGGFQKKLGHDESMPVSRPAVQRLLIKMADILDNIQAEPGSALAKLKIMYDSCMNVGSSDLRGTAHFQAFLKNKLGITNWPYLDSDFKFVDSSVSKLLGHLKYFKEFPILDVKAPKADTGDNYTYKVLFNRYHDINETELKPKRLVQALEYFDLPQEDIEIIINDVEFVGNSVQDLYSNYKHTMCEENCTSVYVNCSNISDEEWILLCETVKAYHNAISGKERKDDAIVIKVKDEIFVKNFLSRLYSLPPRSVANHFAAKIFLKHLEKINFYFRQKKMKFEVEELQFILYSMPPPDLFTYCLRWIATNNLYVSLGIEFYRHYLETSILDEVSDIFDEIKFDMKRIFEVQEWIPPYRKSRILTRIGNTTLTSTILKNLTEIRKEMDYHYILFHPTRESFFDNALEYQSLDNIDFSDPKLNRVMDILFGTNAGTLTSVDRYLNKVDDYEDLNARISLDYAYFFPPYYTHNLRRDVNLVNLAHTLGHEYGHHLTLLLGLPVWNHTDIPPEYLKAKQCIDHQFSEFKFEFLQENLNGTQYSDENLADYFTTALLDKLLEEYDSAPDKQFLLPGVVYSTKQLLYISAFQTACDKGSPMADKYHQTPEEPHAPWTYRIIGSSQNSRSYSNLFQCPEGSFMNPKKKCSLLSGF